MELTGCVQRKEENPPPSRCCPAIRNLLDLVENNGTLRTYIRNKVVRTNSQLVSLELWDECFKTNFRICKSCLDRPITFELCTN